MDFDDVLPEIGDFGLYQKFIYFLLCIPATLPSVFTLFNSIFISATPDHWCRVPQLDALDGLFPNDSLKMLSVPKRAAQGFENCEMYDLNYTAIVLDALAGGTVPSPDAFWPRKSCDHGWHFDTTYYDNTLVTETNAVCDDAWKVSTAQSAFYVGSVAGNLLFGIVGDRYGRRSSFLITILVNVAAGIGATFPVNYKGYIIWRGIVGLTYPAIFQIPFIMSMELMSPEKRSAAGMFVCAIYGIALMSLAGLAYLLRDWFALSLTTSVPFVTLLGICWFVPESPRWLLSQNRFAEAEVLVQNIAKTNGKKIPADFLHTFMQQRETLSSSKVTEPSEPVSFARLGQYPNLLKKIVVVTFSWTANTMVYNGLSFAVSAMRVSEYVSFTISGAAEVPGVLLAWAFMEKYGRRPVMVVNMLLGGLACLSTILLPPGASWSTLCLLSLGKMTITASFATIYVYSAELFPTVLRTFAMGFAAMTASISLIVTPYILFLGQLYGIVIPSTIFGGLSIAGGTVVLLLPETMKVRLPQTLSEAEAFGKDVNL